MADFIELKNGQLLNLDNVNLIWKEEGDDPEVCRLSFSGHDPEVSCIIDQPLEEIRALVFGEDEPEDLEPEEPPFLSDQPDTSQMS